MKITTEFIDHISQLSRLRLAGGGEGQNGRGPGGHPGLYGHPEHPGHLRVEPLSHVFPVKNVLREDEVQPSMDRGMLLKNAPAADDEAFLVPKTVE